MSVSLTRLVRPVRRGIWGLTLDSLANPTMDIVLRYPTEGWRHSEPYAELCRLPYKTDYLAMGAQTAMPEGTAKFLDCAIEDPLGQGCRQLVPRKSVTSQ